MIFKKLVVHIDILKSHVNILVLEHQKVKFNLILTFCDIGFLLKKNCGQCKRFNNCNNCYSLLLLIIFFIREIIKWTGTCTVPWTGLQVHSHTSFL